MDGEAKDPVAWLRRQIEARLALARKATPGPWRWGDWSVTFGTPEVERNTLEHAPAYGPFPAPARLRDDGSTGVLRLLDSLEVDPDQEASALYIAANDPQDTIARCEAELAILAEHASDGWTADPECVRCANTHPDRCECGKLDGEHWRTACPYPCRTISLLLGAYKHRNGYDERWTIAASWASVP